VLERAFRLAKPGISVQIEVENLAQLDEALSAGAKLILLDNFDLAECEPLCSTPPDAPSWKLRRITLDRLREVALTGVDRISIGALTKDVEALDLSMRFTR